MACAAFMADLNQSGRDVPKEIQLYDLDSFN